MSYNPSLLVANSVLHTAFLSGDKLTHMKLQKMIYLVFKKYLKDTGDGLFNEPFLAWQSGPVLQSVYDVFKDFSSSKINSYIVFGKEKNARIITKNDEKFYYAVAQVYSQFGKYSGLELKNITCNDSSAWHMAISRNENKLRKVDIWHERW